MSEHLVLQRCQTCTALWNCSPVAMATTSSLRMAAFSWHITNTQNTNEMEESICLHCNSKVCFTNLKHFHLVNCKYNYPISQLLKKILKTTKPNQTTLLSLLSLQKPFLSLCPIIRFHVNAIFFRDSSNFVA